MMPGKHCSECGALFSCGCEAGSCWCNDYPALMPTDFSRDCRCPACLATAIGRKIEDRLATLSHAEALRIASQPAPAHRHIEHIDYTMEAGKLVFTRWFLLKQGECCGNGCRNCPYPENAGHVSSWP